MNTNRIYLVGYTIAGVTMRQRRWTWRRDRAQRWADRLAVQTGLAWHVIESRLV